MPYSAFTCVACGHRVMSAFGYGAPRPEALSLCDCCRHSADLEGIGTPSTGPALRPFRQGSVAAVVVADDGTVLSHHRTRRAAERTVRDAVASFRRRHVVPAIRVVGRDDEAWAAVAAAHPEWDRGGR